MLRPDGLNILCDRITAFMAREIVLDISLLHFLSSTFSITNQGELECLNEPGRENDRELFLELAVAPDFDILEIIEPFIWNCVFTDEDERELTHAVIETTRGISVRFPGGDLPLFFDVPPDLLSRFIARMHITYPLSRSLLDSMDSTLSLDLKIKSCVRLRRITWPMDRRNEAFLNLFIGEARCFGEKYLEHFEFALSLLNRQKNDINPKDELIARLRAFQKTQDQIRTAEEMMKKNTMESLMSQGFRIPPASPYVISACIAMVKRILSCLYGWVDMGDDLISEIDLGEHTGGGSMEQIIRLLS